MQNEHIDIAPLVEKMFYSLNVGKANGPYLDKGILHMNLHHHKHGNISTDQVLLCLRTASRSSLPCFGTWAIPWPVKLHWKTTMFHGKKNTIMVIFNGKQLVIT